MKQRVAFVGYGEFTKLMIRHMQDEFEIVVYSRNPETKETDGLNFNFISLEVLRQEMFIIISVPAQYMAESLKSFAKDLQPGALVVDVASVKVKPVQQMIQILPNHVEILATHPIFGPGSARGGLDGLQIVVHPVRIKDDRYVAIKDWLASKNLQVIEMSPDEHDRQMAYVLGITQAIGRVMKDMELPDLDLSTPGYEHLKIMRDIQGTDTWALFQSIHNENSHARPILDQLIDHLDCLRSKLDDRR